MAGPLVSKIKNAVSAKRNPLYAKKPGESASDHLKRLRREFPKKFGKQPGVPNKNPTRKFTAADIAAAEARGREKAKKEITTAIQPPANEEKKTVSPAPVPITPAAVPSTAAPLPVSAPQPLPASPNNPASQPSAAQTVSETEIFSPVPPLEQNAGPENPPPQPPPPPAPGNEADGKRYGVMIWGMIVKIFCGIFGEGFQPMVLKSESGEVIYDENIEGIKVWTNWLVSIGVKAFSPIVELWMFMTMYVGMRFGLIVQKFRRKKPASTATRAGAAPEPSKEPPVPPKPASTPEPQAPPKGRTPAPEAPAPAGTVEIAELDSNDAFL